MHGLGWSPKGRRIRGFWAKVTKSIRGQGPSLILCLNIGEVRQNVAVGPRFLLRDICGNCPRHMPCQKSLWNLFKAYDLVASLGFSVSYRTCTPKQAKVYVHRRCCFREITGDHEHGRGNIVKDLCKEKIMQIMQISIRNRHK